MKTKNIDHLVKRMKQQVKELDQEMFARYRNFELCDEMNYIQFFKYDWFFVVLVVALSNRKEFSFSSSKMIEL